GQAEAGQAEAGQAETGQAETGQAETGQAESVQPETGQAAQPEIDQESDQESDHETDQAGTDATPGQTDLEDGATVQTVADTATDDQPTTAVSADPAGAPAATGEGTGEVVDRAPGEVSESPIALWTDEAVERLRENWRDVQVRFIDDPQGAVDGAKEIVTEAVQQLASTLMAAQEELDPYRGAERVDTETMRVAMRRYREFLDRVLAL